MDLFMETKKQQILVILRECRDPHPPALLSSSGCFSISERDLRLIPNPADLCALEKALQLRDTGKAEITVLAIGPERLEDTLRMALAMGADRAIRVFDSLLESEDSVAQARILSRIMSILEPALIFTGYRRQDKGVDTVPALAAAQSGIPSVHSVISIEITEETVQVLRKSDRGGRQQVISPLPCTLLFEEEESTRYPSIESILQSLKAPIEQWGASKLGLSYANIRSISEYTLSGEYGLPRPDPIRVTTPDPSLPAFERITALLQGGIKPRQGRIHFLSADETANALLSIIQQETSITREEM
jgi:electron transfer flavoprotein beta subunit